MAVINGTFRDDDLVGTNDPDTIRGRGGNDRIQGLDGDDRLLGGFGNDTLIGGRGADTNLGGPGRDTIVWNNGDGSDRNDGGLGIDTQVVNGSSNEGDQFEVGAGGAAFLFRRVNLVEFTLDDQNVERLEVNGLGGDDSLTVGSLVGTDLHR